MYYPTLEEDSNTRSMIDKWYGYNHNYLTNSGEFFDMENLTSDYFPLMAPRKTRALLKEYSNIRGIVYTNNTVYVLDGDVLKHGDITTDLSGYMDNTGESTQQTLLRFGAYILIFPLGIYINIYDHGIGRMAMSYETGENVEITYSICEMDGEDFDSVTAADTAPTSPKDGDYWLNTGKDSGLNIWYKSKSMWQPVATTYIRIRIPGAQLTKRFKQYDTIFMNTELTDINNGSQIVTIADDYIVVTGIMSGTVEKTQTTSSSWKLKLERRIPALDYVCTDKNRVWGCHYGYSADGEMINEIYCSKLADFCNWYTYQSISTDSYAVNVGVTGEWTGCISYRNHPVFFKENAIFTVYGSYPSEYQIVQNDCRGVQLGSSKSLAIVGETLFYKSASDVCAYDGSTPTGISDAFGRDQLYYDAVGGGCLNKYHVSMSNAKGKHYFFTYDISHAIWEKESELQIEMFSSTENGQIYGATKKKLYGFGSTDNILYLNPYKDEEWVKWYAETGEIGYETPDSKYVNRISIRAYIPVRSEIVVEISHDDQKYVNASTLRGANDIISKTIDIYPARCDHFKIRFSGHGDCRIYSMSLSTEYGG